MTQPVSEPMTDIAYSIIDDIFGWIEPRDFAIRLWDGNTWGPDADLEPSSTVVLRRPSALRRMLMKPTEENFAECYISGEFDLEEDLEATVPLSRKLIGMKLTWWQKLQLGRRLLQLPSDAESTSIPESGLSGSEHSVDRDRQAVTHHYDVSNDFYRLWLDERMVYSCA